MTPHKHGPRPPGFYWVRYGDEWTIAEHVNGIWFVTGLDDAIDERDLIVGEFVSAPRDWNDQPQPVGDV